MTATNKAPAGGMTSVVNGQRYEGGEFMPITGMFCGRGKNRVTTARFEEAKELAAAAGYELRWQESFKVFGLFRNGNRFFAAANLETLARMM